MRFLLKFAQSKKWVELDKYYYLLIIIVVNTYT
nr:MAG TPA: hypothetical protein [Caudoviricetes sp.]